MIIKKLKVLLSTVLVISMCLTSGVYASELTLKDTAQRGVRLVSDKEESHSIVVNGECTSVQFGQPCYCSDIFNSKTKEIDERNIVEESEIKRNIHINKEFRIRNESDYNNMIRSFVDFRNNGAVGNEIWQGFGSDIVNEGFNDFNIFDFNEFSNTRNSFFNSTGINNTYNNINELLNNNGGLTNLSINEIFESDFENFEGSSDSSTETDYQNEWNDSFESQFDWDTDYGFDLGDSSSTSTGNNSIVTVQVSAWSSSEKSTETGMSEVNNISYITDSTGFVSTTVTSSTTDMNTGEVTTVIDVTHTENGVTKRSITTTTIDSEGNKETEQEYSEYTSGGPTATDNVEEAMDNSGFGTGESESGTDDGNDNETTESENSSSTTENDEETDSSETQSGGLGDDNSSDDSSNDGPPDDWDVSPIPMDDGTNDVITLEEIKGVVEFFLNGLSGLGGGRQDDFETERTNWNNSGGELVIPTDSEITNNRDFENDGLDMSAGINVDDGLGGDRGDEDEFKSTVNQLNQAKVVNIAIR